MKLRRLIALALTLLIAASLMVPAAWAAGYQGAAVPIEMTVAANEKSNHTYDVRYTASLTIRENDAAAFAVFLAGKSKEQLEKLTFVCVLGDNAIRESSLTSEQLNSFTMTDSKNIYELVGEPVQKNNNNLTLTYKLNDATTTAWAYSTAEAIKDAMTGQVVSFRQSNALNVPASAVAGTITTDAFIDIYYGDALYNNSTNHAAYGSAQMVKYPYSSGGGGGSSSSSGTGSSGDINVPVNQKDTGSGDTTTTQNGEDLPNVGGKVTITTAISGQVARTGVKMKLTIKVNPGKTLTSIFVLDKRGVRLSLSYKGNGEYEFDYPEGGLGSVEVEYKKTPYLPKDSGVDEILITDEHILYTIGDDLGTWRPDATVARSEVAMMLYRLLRKPDVGTAVTFSDVPANAWYANAVKAISYLGVIKGYEDGTFRPDAAITRAEFTAICTRFVKEGAARGGKEFADVLTSSWAHEEIAMAEALGWIIGYPDGYFRPDNELTRTEAVTIINRVLGRPGDDVAIKAGKGNTFPDVPMDFWGYNAIIESTTPHTFSFDEPAYTESWNNV